MPKKLAEVAINVKLQHYQLVCRLFLLM